MSLIDGMNGSGYAMIAQAERLKAISGNLANLGTVSSDKEGAFKANLVHFNSVNINGVQTIAVDSIVQSKAPNRPIYDPNNPLSDDKGYVYGSNVNREEVVADMMSAEQSYQANLQMATASKRLIISTISAIKE